MEAGHREEAQKAERAGIWAKGRRASRGDVAPLERRNARPEVTPFGFFFQDEEELQLHRMCDTTLMDLGFFSFEAFGGEKNC
jgi:hypothetical protein